MAKKLKVRIAVGVDSDGKVVTAASTDAGIDLADDLDVGELGPVCDIYLIEVPLPTPATQKVKAGKVKHVSHTQDDE